VDRLGFLENLATAVTDYWTRFADLANGPGNAPWGLEGGTQL
jgi:hypothetical protein